MTGLNTLFLSFSAMQIVVFVALAIYYFKVSAPVSGTTEWINMAEKKRENISSQPATISLKNVLLAFAFAIVAGIGKYLILSVGKTGGALSLDGSLAAINGASLSAPVFGILSGLIFICISLFCHNTFAASVATGAFILIYSLSFPGPGLALSALNDIVAMYAIAFIMALIFLFKASSVPADKSRLPAIIFVVVSAFFTGALMIDSSGQILALGFALLFIFHLYDLSKTYLEKPRPFPFWLYILLICVFLLFFAIVVPAALEFIFKKDPSLGVFGNILQNIKSNLKGFFDGFRLNGLGIFKRYGQLSSLFCLLCLSSGIAASIQGIIKRKDSFLLYPLVLTGFSLIALLFVDNYILLSGIIAILGTVFLAYIFDVMYTRGRRNICIAGTVLVLLVSVSQIVYYLMNI